MTIRALPLIGAITIIILSACSTPKDPASAAYWVERLDSKETRNDALKQLGKIGDQTALPTVLHWFGEKGPWQPNAAYALGQLGDQSVIAELIAGIDYSVGKGRDKKTQYRNKTNLNIARALALLNSADGIESIVRLTTVPDNATRVGAIKSLGDIGSSRAASPLINIATTETQPFVRKTAIQALGHIGDISAVPSLIENLYKELPGVSFYYEARFSLIQIGAPAIAKLIETLERKNQAVEAIRMSNGMPIADGAIEGKAAFVLASLRARQAEKKISDALKIYYNKYRKREREPVFASVPGAVAELAYSLGLLGSEQSVNTLLPLVAESDPNIRAAATEALTTMGAHVAVPQILRAAKTGSEQTKRPAIVAACLLGNAETLKHVEQLKNKAPTNSLVSKTINSYLPALEAAVKCVNQAPCWNKKLGSDNVRVRLRAAYELGWLQAIDAKKVLLQAAEDTDPSVRIAATLSLGKLGNIDLTQLRSIRDRWAEKIAYKDSTRELKRLIARLESES